MRKLLGLALGSVGIVYGDIGTSPLYAFREALKPIAHDGLERAEIIALTSLMIWSLTIIVTIKYVLLLLRADNGGEGGTLSLLALLMKKRGAPRHTADDPRADRRGAVSGRRHDHAGAFGAFSGGGA